LSSAQSAPQPEVHEYQAEMQKLLDILVHSLYTEREIFLRELLSNSADALSKVQFLALTSADQLLNPDASLQIELSLDEEQQTITIEDTGCGMTREELIENLGTIASSGTLKFLREAQQSKQAVQNLIGQFGVGFYAVFMVADKVELTTRSWHPESQAWSWNSSGSGKYELALASKEDRGTKIVLHLKEEAKEFCNEYRLKSIVSKYSNYVPHPIQLKGETINKMTAIWTQSKETVSQKDYEEFYKQISYDHQPALQHLHLSIDAPMQYYALLYIPQKINNEVLYARDGKGLALYAQKVLIQPQHSGLLPSYLRFVQGVVDSEDLPLNVSRESVQQNALVERIKKSLTTRLLKELQTLAENNSDSYNHFWKEFGALLKEGVSADFGNRSKLMDLLRFNSSLSEGATADVSLKDYVIRMRDEQKEIYYIVGPSRESLQLHPNLEYFRKQSLEVLFLHDHIDDFLMNELRDYDGKAFKSISQADIDVPDPVEDNSQMSTEQREVLLHKIKQQLGDRIKDVIASKRLVDSPCSLVNPQENMSAQMERMMKMVNEEYQISKRNLEVNLKHPILQNLAKLAEENPKSEFFGQAVQQLFRSAMLVEGLLDNPTELLPDLYDFMEAATAHKLTT
jgi:molecular chaperone HtpG